MFVKNENRPLERLLWIQPQSRITAIFFMAYATAFGIKILAAVAFWVVGRYLIGLAVRLVEKSLERQKT